MNSSRVWLERDLAAFVESLRPQSRVLDAGSGDQRYKKIFSGHIYESADFEKVDKAYRPSTYVCDLASIPINDDTFDAIIFTQVMEHLPNPSDVVSEFMRILKPGGSLFYSGPLLYEEHEKPYDFYRYTQYGVRHIFEAEGFVISDIHWLEGYMGTLAYLLKRIAKHLPLLPRAVGHDLRAWFLVMMLNISKPLLKSLARMATHCDARLRYTGRGFPMNYVAIMQKPKHGRCDPLTEGHRQEPEPAPKLNGDLSQQEV